MCENIKLKNLIFYLLKLKLLFIFLFIISSANSKIIEKKKIINNELPKNFKYLNSSNIEGPITINKNKDDGKKRNFYKIITKEDDSFYYNYDKFSSSSEKILKKSEYFCEFNNKRPIEGYKGYDISCPMYYTISVEKAFYGRYANDTKNCIYNDEGDKLPLKKISTFYECGINSLKFVKELCENKSYCSIIPNNSIYNDNCKRIFKYLHVNYSCLKKKKLNKEKILIVMFSNKVESNSLDENAISEFYQYANIHGYDISYDNYNYMPERSLYYMKFNTIIEKLIVGLKEKKYDWIFYVDTDVIITNPNIKLESFLPNENMNKIHFIGADDHNGLNAGVFFLRVHPWSLNLLMRASTYSYFNNKKRLKFYDQSALNNVLTENDESEHYIIVPKKWFNNYLNCIEKGDFLLHLAGKVKRNNTRIVNFRETLNNEWYLKTNKEMREEVLKYYELPNNIQHHIKPE